MDSKKRPNCFNMDNKKRPKKLHWDNIKRHNVSKYGLQKASLYSHLENRDAFCKRPKRKLGRFLASLYDIKSVLIGQFFL